MGIRIGPACGLLAALLALTSGAQEMGDRLTTGYIQVRCPEPGVLIYLDDVERGRTVEELGGLILRDVPPGVHRLEAVRAGYERQLAVPRVIAGQVALVELQPWRRQTTLTPLDEADEAEHANHVGRLLIRSVPVEVTVEIPALEIDAEPKATKELLLQAVPTGAYQVNARYRDQVLSLEAVVKPGGEAIVMFDFVRGLAFDQSRRTTRAGMVFVPIPPGSFRFGPGPSAQTNDDDPDDDSEAPGEPADPRPEIEISRRFWISEHEVTLGQWRRVMGDDDPSGLHRGLAPDQPVLAPWGKVQEFLTRLAQLDGLPPGTYRLPSEAEWEYAAKAGQDREFHGPIDRVAWYRGTSTVAMRRPNLEPMPVLQLPSVRQKTPNDWGLYDVHGSLWEWCLDAVSAEESGLSTLRPTDRGKAYGNVDPCGFAGAYRVVRGGDYTSQARECAAGFRGALPPAFSAGFRIVRADPDWNPLVLSRQIYLAERRERFEAAVAHRLDVWSRASRYQIIAEYLANRDDPVFQEALRRREHDRDRRRRQELERRRADGEPDPAAAVEEEMRRQRAEANDQGEYQRLVEEELERLKARDEARRRREQRQDDAPEEP